MPEMPRNTVAPQMPIGTVSHIQNMLRKLSFYNDNIRRIVPDGLYGEQTTESVKSFQRSQGLPETGEVDNDTWDRLVVTFDETERLEELQICLQVFNENGKELRPGDANSSLYVIQAMMYALAEKFSNIGPVYVTGIYDAATSRAVERIQVISGITPNGKIDREFVNSLAELYNVFITRNRVENSSHITQNSLGD